MRWMDHEVYKELAAWLHVYKLQKLSSLMSKWRQVMSGIPHELVLGPWLFKILVGDMD